MVHLKIVLEQLACLHASSFHWIETYPGGLERFKKDFWPMNGKVPYIVKGARHLSGSEPNSQGSKSWA